MANGQPVSAQKERHNTYSPERGRPRRRAEGQRDAANGANYAPPAGRDVQRLPMARAPNETYGWTYLR
ncbi:hypothetical protein EVAR_72602_1 [Eumeta japonica]|uniref:Uncharacterized protein n=1 Tax=Eumeta variegata TaxID=151549 RepID=A0A4C1TAB0_EUMVA|nr:hypothetical protein EVAR_72602_1 [Eumeta japonica]